MIAGFGFAVTLYATVAPGLASADTTDAVNSAFFDLMNRGLSLVAGAGGSAKTLGLKNARRLSATIAMTTRLGEMALQFAINGFEKRL